MIPLYKPHMPELPELDQILHSGQIACGKYSYEFEEIIANYLEVDKDCVLVTSSFNTAISVTLSLLGLDFGDEVIISPMACLASTQPFATQGIVIKWGDVDPATGTLCPESVRKKISKKTKAIVHNHFCGYPGYIDEINAIGNEYGIPVIDDGIECFGSEYKGKKIGNVGTDVTMFSFTAVRNPNTVDGGCIVLKDKELVKKAKMIRDCGIDRSIFRDEIGEINPLCDISLKGYSATMSNVNAYIGIQQMFCVTEILGRQRENARVISRIIENSDGISSLVREETFPNYWVYGVLCNNKREFINTYREKGLYASGVHINNNIYTIFGKSETLKGVQKFYENFVAIPSGWWVQEKDYAELNC